MDDESNKSVKFKLDVGTYIAVRIDNRGALWAKYDAVKDVRLDKIIDYVQCKTCKNVYKYETTRTSHLLRHKCGTIQSENSCTPITAEDKKLILKACVNYCTRDLRSFNSISGPGCAELLQAVINLTQKYGNISPTDILPHPTTVSRHIVQEAQTLKVQIMPEIIAAIEEGQCAATTGFWRDSCSKAATFYTVTVHYLKEWKLIERVLFMAEFPDEKKTPDNILRNLTQRLAQFGIEEEKMKKIRFVTEQESNIIKALEDLERLNCAAHQINCALKHAFQEDGTYSMTEVADIMEQTKDIVEYLNRTGYVTRLPHTLHQETETRWNSKIKMLSSFVEQYAQIRKVLANVDEIHRTEGYNVQVAKSLIPFLKPFEEAITVLQAEKSPTLHLVPLWYYKLLMHCEIQDADSSTDRAVKRKVTDYLKRKFVLHKYQKMATFLFPTFRTLLMFPEEERRVIIEDVKEHIKRPRPVEPVASTSGQDPPPQPGPSSKRLKAVFSQWVSPEDSEERDEVKIYLSLPPMQDDNVLEWWNSAGVILPGLQRLARKVFAIPGSSAPSERCFKAAGLIMQESRSRLEPDILDGTLFLHNNLQSSSD